MCRPAARPRTAAVQACVAHDVGMAWGQSDSYAGGSRGRERERERTADRGQTRPPPPPGDGAL